MGREPHSSAPTSALHDPFVSPWTTSVIPSNRPLPDRGVSPVFLGESNGERPHHVGVQASGGNEFRSRLLHDGVALLRHLQQEQGAGLETLHSSQPGGVGPRPSPAVTDGFGNASNQWNTRTTEQERLQPAGHRGFLGPVNDSREISGHTNSQPGAFDYAGAGGSSRPHYLHGLSDPLTDGTMSHSQEVPLRSNQKLADVPFQIHHDNEQLHELKRYLPALSSRQHQLRYQQLLHQQLVQQQQYQRLLLEKQAIEDQQRQRDQYQQQLQAQEQQQLHLKQQNQLWQHNTEGRDLQKQLKNGADLLRLLQNPPPLGRSGIQSDGSSPSSVGYAENVHRGNGHTDPEVGPFGYGMASNTDPLANPVKSSKFKRQEHGPIGPPPRGARETQEKEAAQMPDFLRSLWGEPQAPVGSSAGRPSGQSHPPVFASRGGVGFSDRIDGAGQRYSLGFEQAPQAPNLQPPSQSFSQDPVSSSNEQYLEAYSAPFEAPAAAGSALSAWHVSQGSSPMLPSERSAVHASGAQLGLSGWGAESAPGDWLTLRGYASSQNKSVDSKSRVNLPPSEGEAAASWDGVSNADHLLTCAPEGMGSGDGMLEASRKDGLREWGFQTLPCQDSLLPHNQLDTMHQVPLGLQDWAAEQEEKQRHEEGSLLMLVDQVQDDESHPQPSFQGSIVQQGPKEVLPLAAQMERPGLPMAMFPLVASSPSRRQATFGENRMMDGQGNDDGGRNPVLSAFSQPQDGEGAQIGSDKAREESRRSSGQEEQREDVSSPKSEEQKQGSLNHHHRLGGMSQSFLSYSVEDAGSKQQDEMSIITARVSELLADSQGAPDPSPAGEEGAGTAVPIPERTVLSLPASAARQLGSLQEDAWKPSSLVWQELQASAARNHLDDGHAAVAESQAHANKAATHLQLKQKQKPAGAQPHGNKQGRPAVPLEGRLLQAIPSNSPGRGALLPGRHGGPRLDIDVVRQRFLEIYDELVPSGEEEERRRQFLQRLDVLVGKNWPEASLLLFGSCANALGVRNSDLDVCLLVSTPPGKTKGDLVARMAAILRTEGMLNVQALTHARVPVVKFLDPLCQVSCDVCCNNMLAVANTKLMRDYVQVDVRLRQLALLVKFWAKQRQVNETYKGTLSSYAYVLMCIHFLQLRRPPILPCLQEMEHTYVVRVGDVACAYYDRVDLLTSYGARNREGVGELLSGFFDYWAARHDYNRAVISVRTGSFLSKEQKDWTRRVGNERHLICIEDPFDVGHDLGRVVDRYSIRVLKEEFHRASHILHHDPDPCTKLFEPYVRSEVER